MSQNQNGVKALDMGVSESDGTRGWGMLEPAPKVRQRGQRSTLASAFSTSGSITA
jgi:hypothetical protein